MRFLTSLAFVLGLTLAACGGGDGGADGSTAGSDMPPPECPSGFNSPAYCFSGSGGTTNTCGDCTSGESGEVCHYFEADLICESGKWRCLWAGGDSGGCGHRRDGRDGGM